MAAPALVSSSGLSSAITVSARRRAFPVHSSLQYARLPLALDNAEAAPAVSRPARVIFAYFGVVFVLQRCARDSANFTCTARAAHGPALDTVRSAVADVFRPLLDNFSHVLSLKTVFDTEDYHVGMPFGALMGFIGCYQLWKMDPSTFLDAALGYAFYKLSVLSSQVRRQGFSNAFITRIKFGIVVILAMKDFNKNLVPLDFIRAPVWLLYLSAFLFVGTGLKKDAREAFSKIYDMLQTKEGRRVLVLAYLDQFNRAELS